MFHLYYLCSSWIQFVVVSTGTWGVLNHPPWQQPPPAPAARPDVMEATQAAHGKVTLHQPWVRLSGTCRSSPWASQWRQVAPFHPTPTSGSITKLLHWTPRHFLLLFIFLRSCSPECCCCWPTVYRFTPLTNRKTPGTILGVLVRVGPKEPDNKPPQRSQIPWNTVSKAPLNWNN